MDEDERVAGLLELARQHTQRFRELEDIEWKINFSIWGFLGGLAYLWGNGHLVPPNWALRGPLAFLLLPPSALLLHGMAVVKLNVQQQEQAIWRDNYRRQTAALLETVA
jgi:hypothetical protein